MLIQRGTRFSLSRARVRFTSLPKMDSQLFADISWIKNQSMHYMFMVADHQNIDKRIPRTTWPNPGMYQNEGWGWTDAAELGGRERARRGGEDAIGLQSERGCERHEWTDGPVLCSGEWAHRSR